MFGYSYKKIFAWFLLALVVIFFTGIYFLSQSSYEVRKKIIQNPLVTHFVPSYRALRKISDVVFFPYLFFSDRDIYPQYQITVNPEDIQRMNAALPDDPFESSTRLMDDNKLWVSARFTTENYDDTVKIRYRGNQINHWGNYKKSFLIKFPSQNLFNGQREMTLVITSDRRYFGMELNNYRARKMGLIVPDEELVNLNFNGADHGIYYAFENWTQEWVEKKNINSNSILLNTLDLPNTATDVPSLHTQEGLSYWKSPNVDDPNLYTDKLSVLAELVQHADDETFKRLIPQIIDLETFYARDVISILSGSFHNAGPIAGANNLVMYFDGTEGRFKTIPYNSVFFGPEEGFDGQPSDLQIRIWSIPEFKKARDDYFYEYIKNNKDDDISFIDNWLAANKKNFYADLAKDETNFSFRKKMIALRNAIESYFDDPFGILDRTYDYTMTPQPVPLNELSFSTSFKDLKDVALSQNDFLKRHWQFSKYNDTELILKKGVYNFKETVIIPSQTKLTIEAGATLRLDEGVSIISYSPIIAKGSKFNPIRFIPASNNPWGVLAIVNTESNETVIENVEMTSGSDANVNGVYFSGMLSLYNADGKIIDSLFTEAFADDGINVKRGKLLIQGNKFINNSSDAIDLDFPHVDSQFINNYFDLNKGDSIDLSWSDIAIENNVVKNCGDKGISVGERSNPYIKNLLVDGCDIGVASKDQSTATVVDSEFMNNRIGVAAYRKKEFFGGGVINLFETKLVDNKTDFSVDNLSSVYLDNKRYCSETNSLCD